MNEEELKAALQKAFGEFKAENDKLQSEIQKNGTASATLTGNVANLNEEITKLQDALTKAGDRSDKLEARLNRGGLGGESTGSDDVAKNSAIMARQLGTKTALSAEEYANYSQALETFMRKGKSAGAGVLNTLQVGTDATGVFVSPDKSGRMVKRIYETSPMRQICDVRTIGTDALEGIIDNDQAETGWVGEMDDRPDTANAELGVYRIPVHEIYAQPKITQKLLDDTEFDVMGWHGDKVADKFARTENAAFINGNGSKKPRGFLDYTKSLLVDGTRADKAFQYIKSGHASAFAASAPSDRLIDLVYSLKAAYRTGAVFLMQRATVAAIRKFKGSTGDYLWAPGLQPGQPQTLLSFPIFEAEDMPAVGANLFPIAFGNFAEGYQIVDRVGLSILRDPFTTKGFVKFYTRKRVGGGAVNFEAVKFLKFST